jgi:DNA-binding sugar fermentation-stimulating protein
MLNEALNIIAQGSFVEECKNRFRCKVNLPEQGQVLCYVPSSARLTNLIALEGRAVCLSSLTDGRHTEYSLLARQDGRRYTLLNLNLVNELICSALKKEKRYKRVAVSMNKITPSGYRSDLCASFKRAEYFEIKSLLSDESAICFPSIYGERACRQLKQISNCLVAGERFTYILALLNTKSRRVALSAKNKEFTSLFKQCLALGMRLRIYRLNWMLGGSPMFFRARKSEQAFWLNLREVAA